ncbi:glycosyltransferase family 2 protein [Burkholderia sp. AU32262]|nr:glycosyltransferase family 2 protein [Burkholderia sp. AU32262]
MPRRRFRNNGARGGRRIDFVEIGANTGYDEARNDGFDRVDASRCDIVGFCDADCRPARDWLEHLLAPFARDAITLSRWRGRPAMHPTCTRSTAATIPCCGATPGAMRRWSLDGSIHAAIGRARCGMR